MTVTCDPCHRTEDGEHVPAQYGREWGYIAPVADCGDDRNPSADGCITYREHCTACGAYRRVNANNGHREYSAWRLPED